MNFHLFLFHKLFFQTVKNIILFLLPLAIFGCNTESQSQSNTTDGMISISGKVLNPQGDGLITLYKIADTGREEIGSFQAEADGTFTYELTASEPDFYQLNVYNNQEKLLVAGQENLEITADGKDPEGVFEVKGSRHNELLAQYQQMEKELSEETTKIREKFFASESDEDKAAIEQEYTTYLNKAIGGLKDFVRQSDNSVVAILPIMQLDPDEEYDFLKEQVAILAEKYPDNALVSSYNEKLNAAKATAIGEPAPDISLQNPEGEEVALSSLKGKYVLIDFWASWCGPCRKENPNVVRMYERFKDKDFEIFGVSLDRDKDAWVKAIEADNLGWVHVSDLKFWDSEVVPRYNISGIPMTVLLDKEGNIIAKNLRGKALEDKLEEILL